MRQVKEDMKARDEAKQRKEENADVLRLKGNRFFKAKQFDRALQYYMDSLKASQFRVETLTNIAQVGRGSQPEPRADLLAMRLMASVASATTACRVALSG